MDEDHQEEQHSCSYEYEHQTARRKLHKDRDATPKEATLENTTQNGPVAQTGVQNKADSQKPEKQISQTSKAVLTPERIDFQKKIAALAGAPYKKVDADSRTTEQAVAKTKPVAAKPATRPRLTNWDDFDEDSF